MHATPQSHVLQEAQEVVKVNMHMHVHMNVCMGMNVCMNVDMSYRYAVLWRGEVVAPAAHEGWALFGCTVDRHSAEHAPETHILID